MKPKYFYIAEITVNTFGLFPSLAAVNSTFSEMTGQRLVHRGRLGEIKLESGVLLSDEQLALAHKHAETATKTHLLKISPGCEPELAPFALASIDVETTTLSPA